jgi:hypothetical protein
MRLDMHCSVLAGYHMPPGKMFEWTSGYDPEIRCRRFDYTSTQRRGIMSNTVRMLAFCLLALSMAARAANEELLAVSWPASLLASPSNLRINDIRVELACGEFRAVRHIPSDWSIEVERPVSSRTKLHLSAGHGASDLPNLKALNGAIVVAGAGSRCFDISATVYTETTIRRLTRRDFGLIKTR